MTIRGLNLTVGARPNLCRKARSFYFFLLGLLPLLCCFASSSLLWAEQENTSSSLEEINRQVIINESALKELGVKQVSLENEQKDLKHSIDELRGQEQSVGKMLQEKSAEKEAVLAEIKETETQIAKTRDLSMRRIRALYMTNSGSIMPLAVLQRLLAAEDASRLTINTIFLRRVQEFDKMVVARLQGLQTERARRRQELERIVGEQADLRKDIKARSESLQTKINRQEIVIKEIKAQRGAVQQALNELRAQALRLETVVASLTGAEAEDAQSVSRAGKASPVFQAEGESGQKVFQGSGLKSQIGKLVLPVQGKVVQHFGKQRPTEFEDFVLSKGLDFEAESGSEIRAVAQGRVMFSGQMPRLGNVLILDHGERSYSLYGRLDNILVHSGDIVDGGTKIALVGTPDSKGRNFYFEIRERGKTVNPEEYLKGL